MKYKFYSPAGHLAPVAAVIDYTGNDKLEYAAYFDYDPAEICDEDGEENFDYLSGEDLPQFARNINAAIRRDWEEMALEEYGFMDSFLWDSGQAQASVYEKVKPAMPKIEIVDDKAYAVTECSITSKLTLDEVETLKDFFVGQYSDGWGEGFEQHAIQTKWGALYVCFWPDDFMIETEEEFHARMNPEPEQQEGMQMGV